jgi:hypothetical protein
LVFADLKADITTILPRAHLSATTTAIDINIEHVAGTSAAVFHPTPIRTSIMAFYSVTLTNIATRHSGKPDTSLIKWQALLGEGEVISPIF